MLVIKISQRRWIPLRLLELGKWVPIWNGQEMSACRLLDIVECDEYRESDPVVCEFNADAATRIGFPQEDNVDKIQLFYRWIIPPHTPEYECNVSHDITNVLPLAFQWEPAIVYGTIDVKVPIRGVQVLDMVGTEIMEKVRVSKGVKKALVNGPEKRPCYCWRDFARKVLVNGGNLKGIITIRVEVEDDEFRCEGIQCTWFLTIQARLLMNARSSGSKNDRHAVIVGHSDKYTLQTLRRLLATIGAQSRKTSYIQNTGECHNRDYFKLFWYPVKEDFINPESDHGPVFTAFRPQTKRIFLPYCLVEFADRGRFLVDGVCYLPYIVDEPKLTGRPWTKNVPTRVQKRRHVR